MAGLGVDRGVRGKKYREKRAVTARAIELSRNAQAGGKRYSVHACGSLRDMALGNDTA